MIKNLYKIIGSVCVVAFLGGCATPDQNLQTTFTNACTVYSSTIANLKIFAANGQLNDNQIKSLNTVDAEVTPICADTSGDLSTNIIKVEAALTTLALIHILKVQSPTPAS